MFVTDERTAMPWRQHLKSATALLLVAVMVVAVAFIVLQLRSALPIRFGPLKVRGEHLVRPLAVSITIDIILLAWRWSMAAWRRIAMTSLAACGFLTLVLIARQAGPTWPVADGAMIELYTIHATHAEQLLGPYSQFGWHHPGPFLFYLLVPLYLAGGTGVVALNAGALAINLISLLLIAWVILRCCRTMPSLVTAVVIVLLMYFLRVHAILSNAWNPLVLVLPLTALVIVCAAVATGKIRLLPAAYLLASFVSQTHTGVIPAAVAVLIASHANLIWTSLSDHDCRRSVARWTNLSAWLLVPVWILPVAEQLTERPGNMTLLWQFFYKRPGQQLSVAFRAYADMLAGLFRPDFYIAQGWAFRPSSAVWPSVLAVVEVVAVPCIALWAWRSGRRFHFMLAGLCWIASLVAFWSTTRIPGDIGDYQIFWMSAIGVLNAAVIVGALAPMSGFRLTNPSVSARLVVTTVGLFIIGSAAIGLRELTEAETRSHVINEEGMAVRTLTERVTEDLRALGIGRPLIRTDDQAWSIATGVVVQLHRMGIPFAVEHRLIPLFGRPLSPDGHEDVEISFCGLALHKQLITRPHNIIVGNYDSIFVDAIKLARDSSTARASR